MSLLEADLAGIATFTASGPGVTRLAWSPELFAAYDWLSQRMEEAGLDVSIDTAGNLIGKWVVGTGPAIVLGSHLDTVPQGGRYDGTLGVLAALHAVRLLQARGVEPARPVWVVAFMDEEGARFGAAMLGSRAFCGDSLDGYGERTDTDGHTLADAMERTGFSFERAGLARAVDAVGCFLELHIEQGPVLEQRGIDIGVVEGIVGLVGLDVTFSGVANHAGTTPMGARRDALVAAAQAAVEIRATAASSDTGVATVGRIAASPGAYNVIPGSATLTVDVRAPSRAALDALEAQVRGSIAGSAAREGVEVTVQETHRMEPIPLDEALVGAVERAAALEDASAIRMWSGAGHDAMTVARCVPAAMVFVPSVGGLSHNPAERTELADCERGAAVLARAVELVGG